MTDSPFSGVSPYLYYPDGDAAAEWLVRVFGFGPTKRVADEQGHWSEGEIAVGAGSVHIHGGPAPVILGPNSLLIVGAHDVDELAQGSDLPARNLMGPPTPVTVLAACTSLIPGDTSGTSGRARQTTAEFRVAAGA